MLLSNKIGAARFVLVPHEICVRQIVFFTIAWMSYFSERLTEKFSECNDILLAKVMHHFYLNIISEVFSYERI